MKVLIDNDVRNLFRPLTSDERACLKIQLCQDGPVAPFPVWDCGTHGILLDGHHSREICIEEKIKFEYRYLKFDSKPDALEWVRRNQLGRRNLDSKEMESYRRGKAYLEAKEEKGGDRKSKGQSVPLEDSQGKQQTTAEKVAEKFGVSDRTIKRDAEFAAAVDELPKEERKKILSGESGKTKGEVLSLAEIEKKGVPEVKEAVRDGTLSVPDAAKVVEATPRVQRAAVAQVRKGKAATATAAVKKQGAPKFDDRPAEKLIGQLTRFFDARANVYGKGPKHNACIAAMEKVLAAWTQWQAETNR